MIRDFLGKEISVGKVACDLNYWLSCVFTSPEIRKWLKPFGFARNSQSTLVKEDGIMPVVRCECALFGTPNGNRLEGIGSLVAGPLAKTDSVPKSTATSVLRSPAREWRFAHRRRGNHKNLPYCRCDRAPQEGSGVQGPSAVDGVAVHLDTESRLSCGSRCHGIRRDVRGVHGGRSHRALVHEWVWGGSPKVVIPGQLAELYGMRNRNAVVWTQGHPSELSITKVES